MLLSLQTQLEILALGLGLVFLVSIYLWSEAAVLAVDRR